MKYTHYHLDKSQRKAPPLCGRIHYVTMLHSQQHPLFRNRFCLATAASLAGTELFICYLTFMVILSMCLTLLAQRFGINQHQTRRNGSSKNVWGSWGNYIRETHDRPHRMLLYPVFRGPRISTLNFNLLRDLDAQGELPSSGLLGMKFMQEAGGSLTFRQSATSGASERF